MAAQRVLICEDSRVYAAALQRMLEYESDIEVIGVCRTAEQAIAALPRRRPDLVTMDVELPGMNGIAAVTQIMDSWPLPILVLSGHVRSGNDAAAAALAAGALDAIAKDDLDLRDPAGTAGTAFRRRVRLLSRARVIRHLGARLSAGDSASEIAGARGQSRRASVIGVCASTGGPQVLARLLEALPADYPIPVLVVQHMAAGFTAGFARWLDQTARLPVAIASDGAPAGPGARIAPEGAHLRLAPTGRLTLDRHTVAGSHRPSGDVLLGSIAAAAGSTGVAVVLSGMGADGAAGAAEVRARGGLAIAQDKESSAVHGMPGAAINLGVRDVLSPAGIAACLLRLAHVPLPGATQ
jgi:two-component system, chemotaxis family, protein-glutamate methylesterase/glutaminase